MNMRLRYDPFIAFLEDLSPLGLHVRQSILGERTQELALARRELVARLKSEQMSNGSWKDRIIPTIESLHSLVLLGEEGCPAGERAVDWLLNDEMESGGRRHAAKHLDEGILRVLASSDLKAIQQRRDMMVNRGCGVLAKTGAALYFSAFFNLEGDPRVIEAFRALDHLFRQRRKKWCTFPCSNNVLRAYVSHPLKKSSRTTKSALGRLEQLQTKSGVWTGIPDFFHTIHIVASSSLPSAGRQFERAYHHLYATQNEDGTWGRANRRFKTFLALDALVRQGYLVKRHGLKKFVEAHQHRSATTPRHKKSGPEIGRPV